MRLKDRNIFLIDGIGAAISAAALGLILPNFAAWIGIKVETLYALAAIALSFAIYSLCCHRWAKRRRNFLLAIAVANTCYCLLTATVLATHTSEVTLWGWGYFGAEIIVILSLVIVEVRLALS